MQAEPREKRAARIGIGIALYVSSPKTLNAERSLLQKTGPSRARGAIRLVGAFVRKPQ